MFSDMVAVSCAGIRAWVKLTAMPLHEQIVRDEKVFDVLTSEKAGLRLMLSRLGAEPVSLARRDAAGEWRGFLYRDGDLSPAAHGWNNHATVMGYYVHRLKSERTTYRGREMRGGTHSFLRHKTFDEPDMSVHDGEGSLTYRIAPEDIEPHEYPFRTALAIRYSIQKSTLRVTFECENQELELSTHVSFGLHPGFAVESLEACEVILPPGVYVRHLAPGNFLSGETERIEHAGGPMPFDKTELPGSFLLELAGVPDREFIVRDATRETRLDFSEAPFVTLWSDGGNFVCVEPCWGLPDHHQQRPFEEKLGIIEIPPRGILERSFTIAPRIRPD